MTTPCGGDLDACVWKTYEAPTFLDDADEPAAFPRAAYDVAVDTYKVAATTTDLAVVTELETLDADNADAYTALAGDLTTQLDEE